MKGEPDKSAAGVSQSRASARLENLPRPRFDLPGVVDLPVVARREEIAAAIRAHQVVVVCGATGSGKTTQLPKICLEAGRGVAGMIGHTQPRRIAARAVAARIAQELGTNVGGAVGYKVRFTDQVSERTFVKVMTDGILLAETQRDRLLRAYDTIIIDEAHERSLNIDFLLGYLRQLLPRRPDLKVIITSATIDPKSFSEHFRAPAVTPGSSAQGHSDPGVTARALISAPVIEVSGRTYPVQVRYRPLTRHGEDEEDLDLEQGIVEAVEELGKEPSDGSKDRDVLVFLPGEREIRETADVLRKHFVNHPDRAARRTEILPLFARLSTDEQQRIFAPHEHRRVILSTNVAETSLTVPGIKHVIDSGLARISRYSPRIKVQRLPIEPISQASANQRAGRCGRTSPGIAVRLYAEDDFAARPAFTDPEILRTNLASVILQMKALGLGEIDDFPFMQAPDPRNVRDGYDTLLEIGALQGGGIRNDLTSVGARLARLPVDPRIGRMVLAADSEHCLREVLVIAAALAVQDPRERPMDKAEAADAAHALFKNDDSDFLAYLNLWREFHKQKEQLSANALRKWCRDRFVSYLRMREWVDTHAQVRDLAREMGLRINDRQAEYAPIHRALLTGLLSSIGKKSETVPYEYNGARGNTFSIFPGSGLFKRQIPEGNRGPARGAGAVQQPKWLMAAEIVRTTKTYGRTCAVIEPRWIEQIGKHLVKRTYQDPYWDAQSAQVMAYETVSLYGLEIVHRRRAPFGEVDPVLSRTIFIQHALVNGEFLTKAPFFEHNHGLERAVKRMQAKVRSNALLAEPAQRFAFYDARVSRDVNSGRSFEPWLRRAEQGTPRVLEMAAVDVMAPGAAEPKAEEFPDSIDVAGHAIRLEYRHDPGAEDDGVTAVIPAHLLEMLPDERFEWLVPGMVREKVVALIKGLPKNLRASLAPAPMWADRALERLTFGQGSLFESLADAIRVAGGMFVPIEAWDVSGLPAHLVMRFRVIDEKGQTIGAGRSLAALRGELARKAAESMARLPSGPWNRVGVTVWEWDQLPVETEMRDGLKPVRVFPAIVDEGAAGEVSVRPFDTAEKAATAAVGGLRRLLALQVASESRSLIETMPGLQRLALLHAPLGPSAELIGDLANLSAMMAFDETLALPGVDTKPPAEAPAAVRTREQFTARLDWGWDRLGACGRAAFDLAELILTRRQRVEAAIMSAPTDTPSWVLRLADIRSQLEHLILPRFLGRTPYQWLVHFPRYLGAIERRLERVRVEGEERDLGAMDQILPFWKQYLLRVQHARTSPGMLRDPAFIEYRWMLEELRVSLFAQQLGTAASVSAKRMATLWERVG